MGVPWPQPRYPNSKDGLLFPWHPHTTSRSNCSVSTTCPHLVPLRPPRPETWCSLYHSTSGVLSMSQWPRNISCAHLSSFSSLHPSPAFTIWLTVRPILLKPRFHQIPLCTLRKPQFEALLIAASRLNCCDKLSKPAIICPHLTPVIFIYFPFSP